MWDQLSGYLWTQQAFFATSSSVECLVIKSLHFFFKDRDSSEPIELIATHKDLEACPTNQKLIEQMLKGFT